MYRSRLELVTAVVFMMGVLLVSAPAEDKEALSRIQRLLDVRGVSVSDQDIEVVRLHPKEAISVLDPALRDADPKVRGRSFWLLAMIPTSGQEYVVKGLSSEDEMIREYALKVGISTYPTLPQVASAFISEMRTNEARRVELVGNALELDPTALKDSDALRLVLQEMAVNAPEPGDQNAILLLGKYRDDDSLKFLRSLTNQAPAKPELRVALALRGDQAALESVIGDLKDEAKDLAGRWYVLNIVSKFLIHKTDIQRVLCELLDYSLEGASEDRVKLSKEAARVLARSLTIPPTDDPHKMMTDADLKRIKETVRRKLSSGSAIDN
jgi:hypothetical protein